MPILNREVDLHPNDLLSEAFQEKNSSTNTWRVLYTLPRREKELMRHLIHHDVPFYGPVVDKKTKSPGGRIRTSFVPLFSNYVFIYCSEEQRVQSLKTNCVTEIIAVADQAELFTDLQTIHALIKSRKPVSIESQLQPGRKVRVKNGPLAGREGVIVERRGVEHLVVVLNILQQGVSTLLEDFIVEAID